MAIKNIQKYNKYAPVLLLVCVLLFSCKQNRIYREFDHDFPKNRWMKSDVRIFDFAIADARKQYRMDLEISHVYGYQFHSIPLTVNIEYPDKAIITKTIDLQVTGGDGKQAGRCDGNYCDLSYPVFDKENLPAGNYRISVANRFEGRYLPDIIGVGIEVTAIEN